MIGSYSISWIVTELLSIILFLLCLYHALRGKDTKFRVLTLFCFVLAAALFEHVGVFFCKWYSYDQHRLMMLGFVPLSTLLLESAILYSGVRLFEHMKLPPWCAIWVTGLWSAWMDFSIDPVFVHDYQNGSGQWNWVARYEGSLFGIPYVNFSGWLYMTGVYAFLTLLVHRKLDADKHPYWDDWYPFLLSVTLLVPISLFTPLMSWQFSEVTSRFLHNWEMLALLINVVIGTMLFIQGWRKMCPVDLKQDGIILIVPLMLDAFDLTIALYKKITISYIPVILVLLSHVLLLWRLKNRTILSQK